MKQVLKADSTCIIVLPFKRISYIQHHILLHDNDIIKVGGVLLANVFAFEVPRLACGALYSYLYGVVAVLAVDGIYGSGQT